MKGREQKWCKFSDNSAIYSGAALCAGSVRKCVLRGGGGRRPVLFKGKIRGTHKAGSSGRQAGRERRGERRGKGRLWESAELADSLTNKPHLFFLIINIFIITNIIGILPHRAGTVPLTPLPAADRQPEPGHGKTSFLSVSAVGLLPLCRQKQEKVAPVWMWMCACRWSKAKGWSSGWKAWGMQHKGSLSAPAGTLCIYICVCVCVRVSLWKGLNVYLSGLPKSFACVGHPKIHAQVF